MVELLREIEKFNNEYKTDYITDCSFDNLLELSNEIEFMFESGLNYEQILFKKFGLDYWKDKVVLAISRELENLYKD